MKKTLRTIVAAVVFVAGSCVLTPTTFLPNSQTAPVAQAAGIIQLDAAQQKQLDEFFTAFSSSSLRPFKLGELTNDDMLLFAVNYLVKNDKNLKNTGDSTYGISLEKIPAVTQKYFGLPVTVHDLNNCTIKNDLYIVPKATNVTNTFSSADMPMDNGDGTYLTNVVVYMSTTVGGSPSVYGRYRALFTKTPTGYNLKEYVAR